MSGIWKIAVVEVGVLPQLPLDLYVDTAPPEARVDIPVYAYILRDEMTWNELEGWWTDAGTFESLLRASNLVAETGANKMELKHAEQAGANV